MSAPSPTAREVLAQAMRLSAEDRRRIAETLLAELQEATAQSESDLKRGPYSDWLAAAGSVRSAFSDLSTDKYAHVAASGQDEQP